MELIADVRRGITEGPHFDPRSGLLYFVAIPEGEVHRLDPITGAHRVFSLGRPCGAVVTTQTPGRLLVALADGLFYFDESTEALTVITQPEAHLPGNRFNDAKCDRAGRLFAGTMANDVSVRGQGSLYRLSGSTLDTVLSGVSISNGLDFSPDNRTMYYIDTPTRAVAAFDYDLQAGILSNRRVLARIPARQGYPDGMTVDAAGDLWVALWGGWGVLRIGPDGCVKRLLEVPAKRVSSCAFGGDDLQTLFITTAGGGPVEPAQPHAGGVFAARPGATGQEPTQFDDR
jgi:sugar lactone lactonase YvrE